MRQRRVGWSLLRPAPRRGIILGIVEPIGRWSVGPATSPMTIAFTRLANGTTVVDRIVASGYRPPGAIWEGNVPPPHPSRFRATEFDFLGIVIPAGTAHLQGRRLQDAAQLLSADQDHPGAVGMLLEARSILTLIVEEPARP
jgi:hypothetical protein